jgi:two-component system NtrC family sensor kinase
MADFSNNIEFIRDLIARKSRNSLSSKLLMAIGTLILIGSTIFWYMIIVRGEQMFLQNTVEHAETYTEMIEKTLFANMHALQTGAIQQTIEAIGTSRNIRGIRIFTFDGKVIFSSDPGKVNSLISRDSPSCRLCHRSEGPPGRESLKIKDGETAWMIARQEDSGRFIKLARPIMNRKSCFTASCHQHSPEKKVLGILETDYSLSSIDRTIVRQKVTTVFFGIVFTAFCSVVLCVILWKLIIRPIMLLSDGMKKVSGGDLEHHIEINTRDEMGMIARTFNQMTQELKADRQKLENWAKELEAEVNRKTEEIRRGQEQLFHAEKLASLGRMAAGVAHEINSPLTGIVTFAHLMLKRIPPEKKMDREDLEVIIEQAERCSRIIKGLLGFSRAIPSEKTEIDINATIRQTIDIIRNQAKFHNVKIHLDLDPELPRVRGDASQLQQVYMNLMINAADAMNDRGEVHIATREVSDNGKSFVEIEFTDTGPGIPEEYLGKLFEPFFTTKPVGKGTGLGLAVSHGIIKKHGGYIRVKSSPGKGTSFYLRIPVLAGDEQV